MTRTRGNLALADEPSRQSPVAAQLSRMLKKLRPVPVEAPVRKRAPKRDLSQDDWLPSEEASAVLVAAQDDPRSYAMLSVFLYCGLRCNELRMLDLADYIPATRDRPATIQILHAKGSKTRTVPAGRAADAIEYWLDTRILAKGVEGDCEALFRGRQGRLSNRYLREIVKTVGRRAGLGEKVHPHALRHSYGSHLTINGIPIEVVRVLMGHTSIGTTQLYVAVPDKSRFEAALRLDFS